MKKNELKTGMEVWHHDSWGNVCSGKITGFYEEHPDYVKVKGTSNTYGTQGVRMADCYSTKKGLLAAMKAKSEKRRSDFCAEIKDVNSLVKFMFDNTVSCAEEYTDRDARNAVKIRAKELLGITLEA